MRPVRSTAVHKTGGFRRAGLLELVPLRRRGRKRHRPSACRNAAARLADHARGRRPQAAGRRSAGGRSRGICRGDHGGARTRAADRDPPRRDFGAAAGLGQRHHRHRPPHRRPRWQTRSRRLTGEAALAFFDAIAPIVHRDSIDFDIAWFQSRYDKAGPGGLRRRLHQLSADARAIRGLRRRASRRREDRVPRFRKGDALFRRLPADRGDG